MADEEINDNQDLIPEGQTTDAGEEERIAGLERRIAESQQALAEANARISELEQSLMETGEKLAQTGDDLSQAITSYKQMITALNPEIPDDLISGDSIEAIEASLAQGKKLINRVKQGLEAEIQAVRIPAGAPQRTAPDLSVLSPREKIQYSIRR